MNVIQVAIVLVQSVTVVWVVAKQAAKLDSVSEAAGRIERKQDQESADARLWKAKIEADLADLKVRTALLEARVNNMNYEK